MHLLPLVEKFLDQLATQRNFSAHTVRSYTADLNQFCQFLLAALNTNAPAGQLKATELPPVTESDADTRCHGHVGSLSCLCGKTGQYLGD